MLHMTLTTLVTQVEPGEPATLDAALATPFALAEAYAASLTALVFPIETELAAATTPSWDLAAAEERAVAQLRLAAERRGVSCAIRARSSFAYGVGEVFADHLRVADLGIVTLFTARGAGQRMLLDGAIFDSGRPILMVNQGRPLLAPPSRVVVAWDATPAAVRATHAALPFMRRGTETLVVTVSDDKDLRPGQSGIELTHLLARHGAKARFNSVRRHNGAVLDAISAAAQDAQADLLVMGAMRHSPLRNMILGSATQDLLDRGPRLATLVAA
jgi:nucleotide-binding universal stress UspA family protein